MSKLFPNPGYISQVKRGSRGSRLGTPKAFFMRKIRLLTYCGRASGPKTAPIGLGWKGQSPIGNGNQEGKAGYQYEKRPARTLLRASH